MFGKVVDWVFDLFTLVQTFHGTSLRLYVSTQKKIFLIFSGTKGKECVVNTSVSNLYLSSITNPWEIYSHPYIHRKTPVITTGFLIYLPLYRPSMESLYVFTSLLKKNFLIFSGTSGKGYVVNVSVSNLYLSSITNPWEIYSHPYIHRKTPVITTGFLIYLPLYRPSMESLYVFTSLLKKNFLIFSGTSGKGYVVNVSVSYLYLSSITNPREIYSHPYRHRKTPVIQTGFLIYLPLYRRSMERLYLFRSLLKKIF